MELRCGARLATFGARDEERVAVAARGMGVDERGIVPY
jgi:hypothetical protein